MPTDRETLFPVVLSRPRSLTGDTFRFSAFMRAVRLLHSSPVATLHPAHARAERAVKLRSLSFAACATQELKRSEIAERQMRAHGETVDALPGARLAVETLDRKSG